MARAKRGSHTSARGVFQRSVVWLEGLGGVKKVTLGRHKPCHHSFAPGILVVIQDTKSGLELRGYTDVGVMGVFLVLCSPGETRENIRQVIQKKFSK